ncbi:hypothetical protein CspHIS471_0506980 [Cutaneotrichosporon sp. HIS471]|nr:hypothetical protein CspHIS471_0506980 [Cutaneotrichosporon sp. HIS471]
MPNVSHGYTNGFGLGPHERNRGCPPRFAPRQARAAQGEPRLAWAQFLATRAVARTSECDSKLAHHDTALSTFQYY